MDLLRMTDALVEELNGLEFSPPVAYVYNPLVYARKPHDLYLTRYGAGPKEAVFVGMNPGPWGMAQTGVPFGEVGMVRDWLGIAAAVGRPAPEHPKKRVDGFSCRRSEVSGRRLWGLFRERYGEPGPFFARFFVLNYCPLLFIDAAGRNITPDKLQTAERHLLTEVCGRALRRSVECLRPGLVIGIGNFAARQAATALQGLPVPVGRIIHPSPASPAANRDWQKTALAQLRELGIEF
jgi:single-strand selective monofunctional uracil DNA glycosylase